ncbi:MAG: ribosomal protein L7/L12, partial [Anaerolineales bacterium]|nr:ribosomal protein L7/L12 [Anaerolineales bacterium]
MSLPQAFKCPSCSASLDYDGTAEVVTCDYCGTTVLVPDKWRREPSRVDYSQSDAGNIHEILELTHAGRKIEAIKLYRETFGVGLKEAKDAVEQLERGQPTAVYVTSATVGTVGAATAGASGCGCISPLFVMFILAVVFGSLFYLSNPARGNRIISDLTAGEFEEAVAQIDQVVSNINKATFENPRLAERDATASQPDLLLQTWAYGGSEIPISLSYTAVVSDQRQTSWEIPLGVSGEYAYELGTGDQTLYIAQGTALHAYDKKDGDSLWETVLSDSVQNGCETCIQATREQVIVMTSDNKLEAFDAQNGRSLWQWPLVSETFVRPDAGYQAFVMAGTQVIFIDNLPDGRASDKGLFVLDVASGTQLQLLAPSCPDPQQFFDDDYLGFDSQVIIDPAQNTAVFLFGSAIIDQLCLQK